MFNKKYRSALRVHERAIKELQWKLEDQTAILIEVESDLHAAKHSAKHWKEKYKDLEEDFDKLKKRKKK